MPPGFWRGVKSNENGFYRESFMDEMAAAVALTAGRVELEASGNVTLERVGAIAATGVDYISSGALTHSAPILDISLEVARA